MITPVLLCLLALSPAIKAELDEGYKLHEAVDVIVNKVGPRQNPSETYPYYSLPFCAPPGDGGGDLEEHGLGELLMGDRKMKSKFEINFRDDFSWRTLCSKKLGKKDLDAFTEAIENDYFFEVFIDDIPMWEYVGVSENEDIFFGHTAASSHYLYTHYVFQIEFNGKHIISANVTADPDTRVDVTSMDEVTVEFSYSLQFHKTDVTFEDRVPYYQKNSYLPVSVEIHWLSIVNSFVLVILLTAFLFVILIRVLKGEISKYVQIEELDGEAMDDESGWKLLHADVFRLPVRLNLFCACLGTGAQLLVLMFTVLVMAVYSQYHIQSRGTMYTACIVCYALTAGIGGYVSGKMYKELGGTEWAMNVMYCATVFPLPLFTVFCFLNTVALAHGSSMAYPFGTVLVIFAMWFFVTFPLTVVGGIAGKNVTSSFDAPCRTNRVAREIPPVVWYRRRLAQFAISGFLPFSAIYIELHYIFASIWGHKIYSLFGILMVAAVLLVVVTAFITISMTYFQLAVEDHRWWWRSFVSGGSTGIFIYLYCFYYFVHRTEMFGFLQTSFYFGYMLIVSYGFFLMLGFVGFKSSSLFVHYIYLSIKSD